MGFSTYLLMWAMLLANLVIVFWCLVIGSALYLGIGQPYFAWHEWVVGVAAFLLVPFFGTLWNIRMFRLLRSRWAILS